MSLDISQRIKPRDLENRNLYFIWPPITNESCSHAWT